MQNGKLDAFLRKIDRLPPDRLTTANISPASLPLLLTDDAPQAHAAIAQYGDRAWRLFMSVNFADSPVSIERVAEAVAKYQDLPLEINDTYGLPAALMLVAPPTEKGQSESLMWFNTPIRFWILLAVVLMLLNYDDVVKMLDARVEPEELYEAIDLWRPTRFRADACGRRWPYPRLLLKRGVGKGGHRSVPTLRPGSDDCVQVLWKRPASQPSSSCLDGSARLAGI